MPFVTVERMAVSNTVAIGWPLGYVYGINIAENGNGVNIEGQVGQEVAQEALSPRRSSRRADGRGAGPAGRSQRGRPVAAGTRPPGRCERDGGVSALLRQARADVGA